MMRHAWPARNNATRSAGSAARLDGAAATHMHHQRACVPLTQRDGPTDADV